MGRNKKHPTHAADAERLMNELLDELVALWTSEKEPELKTTAEEVSMSAAKVRKLLITAGVRDNTTYYESSTADHVLKLWREKKTVDEIAVATGLSRSSVTGYLPHTKIVYSLDTLSAEAERIKLYRNRKTAVIALSTAIGEEEQKKELWRCICLFENYPFQTSGRGTKPGVKFTYTITRTADQKGGGRRYRGEEVEGYGNELWVSTVDGEKKKSISRSTVELGYKRAVEASGKIGGPKALGLPGAGSYVFPILIRFGVIKKNEP